MSEINVEELFKQLEDASETHPNLSELWINYLRLKKQAYERALIQAKSTLQTITESPDPDNELLVCIFALSRVIRSQNGGDL